MTRLLHFVRKRWNDKEEAEKKFFKDSLDLNEEVAISWIVSVIKKPIISLMTDPKLSLSLTAAFTNSQRTFVKLSVRVEAIFKALLVSIK